MFVLKNKNGMEAHIYNYGCVVKKLFVPDRNGNPVDVVLGYNTEEDYRMVADLETGKCYMGTFIGRYANRICKGRFSLNGKDYQLLINDGDNYGHGSMAFREYQGKQEGSKVVFDISSPDGEDGFPGNLTGKVSYEITEDNALKIDYYAVCDADTVINLTNHSYFNLNGQDSSNIMNHELMINADSFTEVDEVFVPTGEIIQVKGTPMDFTSPKKIGRDVEKDYYALKMAGGYDHNYILNDSAELKYALELYSEKTGISMKCYTTQPGVQLSAGNNMDEAGIKDQKVPYPKNGGVALETQHYPDSPNHKEFPDTTLRAGEEYRQTTIYKFGLR